MYTGPVSGWIMVGLRLANVSEDVSGVTCPVPSRVSNTTVSPGGIDTRGSSSLSQNACVADVSSVIIGAERCRSRLGRAVP